MGICVCTIVDRTCVAETRLLVRDVRAAHPDARIVVLDLDDGCVSSDVLGPNVDLMTPGEIGMGSQQISRVRMLAGPGTWWTNFAPFLLKYILGNGAGAGIFLHPSCGVFGSIATLAERAEATGVALVPTEAAVDLAKSRSAGASRFDCGAWNAGILAVTSLGTPFVEWMCEQVFVAPFRDVYARFSLAATLFPHDVVTDHTLGLAWWNVPAREIGSDSKRLADGRTICMVQGAVAKIIQFAGFDPERPYVLTTDGGRVLPVLLSEHPALATMCRERASALMEAGWRPIGAGELAMRLPNGLVMDEHMRNLYQVALSRHLAVEQRPMPPEPFAHESCDAYLEWLLAPAEAPHAGGRLSNYLQQVWEDRIEIRMTLPDPDWSDHDAFISWVREHGQFEEDLDPRLVPPPVETHNGGNPEFVTTVRGVHVAGCFTSQLGLGEAARMMADAVGASGVPFQTTTITPNSMGCAHAEEFEDRVRGAEKYNVNIACINLDNFRMFARNVGPGFFEGSYTVAQWFWELPTVPEAFLPAFEYVDEVWVASEYVQEALSQVTDVPVTLIPMPLRPVEADPISRAELDLPEGFAFLFAFDFNSVAERKNPYGLIDAFSRAFEPGEGPILVLKTHNGHLHARELERLKLATATRPDIHVIEGLLPARQKNGLFLAADAYVSLHRSEGLGLTMAEAMALGKPVIATRHGGNLSFMNDSNSLLIDYDLTEVPAGCEPYSEGSLWASPDISQAAAAMRRLADNPEFARDLGARGKISIQDSLSSERCARAVRERLEVIWSMIDSGAIDLRSRDMMRREQHAPAVSAGVGTPATRAMTHLTVGPKLRWNAAGARGFAQRLLLRLLKPYLVRQREFESAVADGLVRSEKADAELIRANQELARRLKELERDVSAAQRDLSRAAPVYPELLSDSTSSRAHSTADPRNADLS